MNQLGKSFEKLNVPAIEYLKADGFGPFLALLIAAAGLIVIIVTTTKFLGFYRKLNDAIKAL